MRNDCKSVVLVGYVVQVLFFRVDVCVLIVWSLFLRSADRTERRFLLCAARKVALFLGAGAGNSNAVPT